MALNTAFHQVMRLPNYIYEKGVNFTQASTEFLFTPALKVAEVVAGKPWTDRTLRQFNLKDGSLMTSFAIVSTVIAGIAITILGEPFIPLALISSFCIFCVSGYIVKNRIHQRLSHEIATIYEEMLKDDINVTDTIKLRTSLQENKFSDFKEEFTELDKYYGRYLKSSTEENKNKLNTYLTEAIKRLS